MKFLFITVFVSSIIGVICSIEHNYYLELDRGYLITSDENKCDKVYLCERLRIDKFIFLTVDNVFFGLLL